MPLVDFSLSDLTMLVGKMILELGDSCMVRCKSSDLVCELDFKTRVKLYKKNTKFTFVITTRAFSLVSTIAFVAE
jgi:hypothetical protein